IYSHMVTLWGNYEGISQHSAVMKLAINRDINEQDLLNSRLEAARHHVRIKKDDLDSLKSLNAFGLDLARLLSIKIHKLAMEV
ncbi:hypothetical protein HEO57_014840, partial [Escherichia coli]|nr:hypothetical protein [Escherichia coli]